MRDYNINIYIFVLNCTCINCTNIELIFFPRVQDGESMLILNLPLIITISRVIWNGLIFKKKMPSYSVMLYTKNLKDLHLKLMIHFSFY